MDSVTLSHTPSRPAAAAPATQSRSAIASDFQTFLRMLTTQIQNQDPLKPTPADQFAVQLATFSSVEQQVRTNELLVALGANGMGQLAGWVGMEGRATGPVRFDGAPITLSPSAAAGADSAQLVVRDELGREVERWELPLPAAPMAWAGSDSAGNPRPAGNYSFELVSFAQGMPIASASVPAYNRIVEVRSEGGQNVVVFASGTVLPASEVTALRRG
jgi:flagellar basal-body rod modification protein FlgD